MRLRNPVLPGFYPDPSICRVGEDFYLVASSFEFFPGLPLFHSRDLVHWQQLGHVLTRESQLPLTGCRPSGGLYAPTLRHHQGRFYVACTNVTGGGNFIVSTNDIRGDWSEPVWVDQSGIDPSLFFDDDGKTYLTSTYRAGPTPGIGMSELELTTGKRKTDFQMIWEGSGGRHPEGPHLYKVGEWYYLMIAEGGTEAGHMETVARAKSPWGPYEACPFNPILTNRNTTVNPVQGAGHADLVQAADGSWWAVFLAYRVTEKYFHHLGRETFLAPVAWRDGWPVINGGKPIELCMDAALLPQRPWGKEPPEDCFDTGKLRDSWVCLRNPHGERYDLHGDGLWLTGGPETLNDEASPTAIFRRQQHMNLSAQTVVAQAELEENGRVGLTAFYQSWRHYDLYLTQRNGERLLCFDRTVDDLASHVEIPWQGGATLRVEADAARYRFSAMEESGRSVPLGEGSVRFLSTESAVLGFTGVMLGLYATGQARGLFRSFAYE